MTPFERRRSKFFTFSQYRQIDCILLFVMDLIISEVLKSIVVSCP